MRPETPSPLRVKWRKTWPDRENDFVAILPDHTVRIYLCETSAVFSGQFYWVASRERYLGSGYAPSAREAALAAERCYFGEG